MQIGMVGLGRMGANMARRLMRGGHRCAAFDLNEKAVGALVEAGATAASSLEDLAAKLQRPRAVWVMLPAGEVTEQSVTRLAACLEPGDTIVDGGNSHYKDDVRRAGVLAALGIRYLDVGTSGGVWGAERGYCLMIGGDKAAVQDLDPIFQTLAPGLGEIPRTPGAPEGTAEQGYLYCGPSGSGHFVKMIHNGIEYGLMQSYAEGFDILRNAAAKGVAENCRYDLNVRDIAEVWRRGSVVGSWLLDLAAMALAESPDLANFTGTVADSGEGRWTLIAALEEEVSADVLAASLFTRFRSRQTHTFAEKALSAMRNKFGGHVERPSGG
jgi:6-phosphogluconate dehydrogenase